MRQLFFILFCFFSVSSWGKSLTREIQLKFENNEFELSDEIKSQILASYLEIGNGDWLCLKSISEDEIIKDKSGAFKIAKIRNNRIRDFLLENGVLQYQFKRKYNPFENIWLFKPIYYKNSVKLLNKSNPKSKVVKSFKNSEGCIFLFDSGNSIEFKRMSFEGFSSDEINVHIQEFNSKYDFVKYGVTSLSEKGMLETQGMYFIEAFSNGEKVNLRPRVSYKIKIKGGRSDVTFNSFYGKETNGQLTWTKNSQQQFYLEFNDEKNSNYNDEEFEYNSVFNEVVDSEYVESEFGDWEGLVVREGKMFETNLVGEFSSLGWINCDRFYNIEEKITMKFSIDGGDCYKPYSVYLIFKDINSVLPVYKITNGIYQTPEIPKGAKATLLALQFNERLKNKLAFQDITVNENTTVDLKSSIVNETDFDNYMRDILF